MAYRGLEHAGPACYRHSAAPASETCAACLQAICEICVAFENTRPHCPPCALKVRRRRAIGRTVTGALGLLVAAGLVTGFFWLASTEAPFDYGVKTPEVRANEALLNAEPCDRSAMLRLTELMLGAGNHRGTLKRVAAFTKRCGEWPRLLWSTYSAHLRLGEHDAAIADASRLVTLSPNDKDFWWWRAQAYEEKGNLDAAVADYQKALEVEPRLTGIPFNLANVLERQGKLCEARQPILQFLQHHPDVTDRERVEQRLERLARDGHCANDAN